MLNSPYGVRGWTVQGGGAIAPSGSNAVYTAPTVMPASPIVTVTVYMTSSPTLTTSYTFTLVTPSPVVTSASPAQLQTGGTQTVTINGSGFQPTTTVTLAGSALTTTYVSFTQITAQVPVTATATGSLSLQVQNPGSGSASFTETIATPSISVATSNLSGTSPTLLLGGTATFTSSVTGSAQTAVNWSMSGSGSVSSSGVYTGALHDAGKRTGDDRRYACVELGHYGNLLTDAELSGFQSLGSANPAQGDAGETIAITLTGSNFVPGVVVLVNNVAAPTTYVSSTSVTVQVTAPANSTHQFAADRAKPVARGRRQYRIPSSPSRRFS